MPLSNEQRERLRTAIGPIVQEAVDGSITDVVKAQIAEALKDFKAERTDHAAQILDNEDRRFLDENDDEGFGIARVARCLVIANNDHEKAAAIAKRDYDDKLGDIVAKALESGDADGGGVFVPSNLAATFIDKLRARAVVRQAGPVTVDLDGGNLRIPRITADPTASWVGEGKRKTASKAKTGSLNFSAKTLQGKTPITTRLLRRSSQNAEQIIRDNMIRVMGNKEDVAFLEGLGTEHSPKGMLYFAAAANKFDATQAGAAATLTEVQADINSTLSKLTDNSVDIDMAAWFMSWRTRNWLAFALRDAEDTPVFKGELTAPTPTLNGIREYHTNNVPNNLGGGNNESRITLAAMNYAWLAEETGLIVRASTEASFEDENGNVVSAFDHGLMVIIIERDMDFVMAHDEAVAVLEAVKYGA